MPIPAIPAILAALGASGGAAAGAGAASAGGAAAGAAGRAGATNAAKAGSTVTEGKAASQWQQLDLFSGLDASTADPNQHVPPQPPGNQPPNQPPGNQPPNQPPGNQPPNQPGAAARYEYAANIREASRWVETKSVGQAGLDLAKKYDPTGTAELTSAIQDLLAASATRGMNASRKAVQDDFTGLADEVLPDSLKKVVHAFDDLTKAIIDKGRQLSRWSGDLQEASTKADVRKMQADFREAQGPGREYARVIDEQSKLETTLRDSFGPLKEAIAKATANILEKLNELWEASSMDEMLRMVGEIAKVVATFISLDPEKILDALVDLPENIWKAWFASRPEKGDLAEAIRNAKADLKRQPKAGPQRNFNPGNFDFPILDGV